jgi:hypothetical protein
MPALSAAVAVIITLAPETVVPEIGAVMETVGWIMSTTLLIVTVIVEEVVLFPAASRATAVIV